MNIKSVKFTKRTASLTMFSEDSNLDRYTVLAISLLMGNYNALRKHSKNDSPIDLGKLEVFKERHRDLLNDIINEMDIDVESM